MGRENKIADEGNTQDLAEDTGDDFENEGADDEAAREGDEEIGSEESDSEDDEQSDDEEDLEEDLDDEDQDEEEEEEEEEPEEEDEEDLKEASGQFDWKKINSKLGKVGVQLEKSFKEAQKTTNKALQEKADLEKGVREYEQAVQGDLQLFSQMNHLYTTNPGVHAAINKALGVQGGSQGNQVPQGRSAAELPPGADPQDPAFQHFVPIVQQLEAQIQQLLNHHQGQQTREQRQQQQQQRDAQVNSFRQGVVSAGQAFRKILGRDPTSQELTKIADKMRTTGHFDGADWVPSLFVGEIQKSAKRGIQQLQKKKRDLPRSGKSGLRGSKTSGTVSKREVFDEEWEKHMG